MQDRFVIVLAACLAMAFGAAAQASRIDIASAGCTPGQGEPASTPFEALPPMPHLGIALGGGSIHGIAHIGVLQELEARGVEPKVVAGTSVGALVGALWASGMPAAQIEALHRVQNWEDVGSFAWARSGLFTHDAVRRRLDKIFAGKPIESWPRRFGAVVTDLATGERLLLSTGDGALAVQASSAVPGFFTPVVHGGRSLIDGGLVEPVPVDAARELGAAFVIAVDVAYRPDEEPATTAAQIAFQALHILANNLAREQVKRADVSIVIDLHETFMKCGREALVAAGRHAIRSAWPQILQRAKNYSR